MENNQRPVIETRGLTKDFGGGRGLFDLNIAIDAGRVHGFLGPNGAGKTTAIRLLMGFLRPDAGGARILGMDPNQHAHLINEHVGYVPGELALPLTVTGRQYLSQSARMRSAADPEWANALIGRLGAQMDVKIGKLSKGNRQKIALIDALQHRPPILILDEPTDGLDPLLRLEVRRILAEHAQAGGTVFLSSHVVHEIQTMCHDVSIVLNGRLQTRARIADLIQDEGLVVMATVPDEEDARRSLGAAGATDIATREHKIRFRVRGDPLPALATLHALGGKVAKLRQGDLEETFLRLYQGETP